MCKVNVNQIQLIGRIGKNGISLTDCKCKNDKQTKRAFFSLATDEPDPSKKGEKLKEGEYPASITQWHNIVAWGRNAENLAKICKSGDCIRVVGVLRYNDYTGKDKDGNPYERKHEAQISVTEWQRISEKQIKGTGEPKVPTEQEAAKEPLPF